MVTSNFLASGDHPKVYVWVTKVIMARLGLGGLPLAYGSLNRQPEILKRRESSDIKCELHVNFEFSSSQTLK